MKGKMSALFIMLLGSVCAINVVSPVEQHVNEGDIVDLGTIGPGQTISLMIDPEVTTGGLFGEGGFYDTAVIAAVPEGWSGEDSKLYGRPLQITISADPNATEGDYYTKIRLVDEYYGEKLENITFSARVTISYDVVEVGINPEYVQTGPDQPAMFSITITNKGSTGDAFEIKSTGSKVWEFRRAVFVPAESSKTIYYEIAGAEEETYKTTISVESMASPIIHDEKEVTVDVHSDIIYDLKATNNGVLIFPIFEGIVYAFLGLIANFL